MGKDLIKILKKNIHWILLILFIIVIVIVINNQYKNKESFRISAAEDKGIENMTRERFFELLEKMIKNASDVNIVINGINITDDILNLVENIINDKHTITQEFYEDIQKKYIEFLKCNGNGDGFSIGGQNGDDEDWAAAATAFAIGVGDLDDEEARSLLGFIIVIGSGAILITQMGGLGAGLLIAAFVANRHAEQARLDDN